MALTKVGELGRFIRDQRRHARLSLRKLSSMAGISNPYLSQIERGLRRPSAEILQAIAKALRISAETMYVKAGILEERGVGGDPVAALLRDLTITDKQKQVLIEIYQTFRHENELETSSREAQARPATKRAVAAAKQTEARSKRAPSKASSNGSAKSPARPSGSRRTPSTAREQS